MNKRDDPSPTVRPLALAEIADALQGEMVGDGRLPIVRLVAPAGAEGPGDLAVATEASALKALASTKATAAVTAAGAIAPPNIAGCIRVAQPRHALARLTALFVRPPHAPRGIHPTAVVEASARLGTGVSIGALAYVGPDAEIGADSTLMPHVTIGAGARLGAGCLLHSGARIGERVVVGDRAIIHHNACIGADGFSFATTRFDSAGTSAPAEPAVRIASLGTVTIGDDVEIGACTTIDRATLAATVVGRGTKIDNLVMIGHNTIIGEDCLIAGLSGVSGSCRLGNRVVLSGAVGIADHVSIGDDAVVLARSGVGGDVEAGAIVLGTPAVPRREFFQQIARIRRLKELFESVRSLAERVARIERGTRP